MARRTRPAKRRAGGKSTRRVPSAAALAPAGDREGRLEELRDEMGLSQPMMARLLGVSTRTVSALENRPDPPDEPVRRRIREIERLWHGLTGLLEAAAAAEWLRTPNDAFSGLRPIEVVERGEIDRLWADIFHAGTGSPS